MAERPRPSMERQAPAKTVVRKVNKPAPQPAQEIDYDYERSVKFANRGCLIAFTTVFSIIAVVLLIGFLCIKGELDGKRATATQPVVLVIEPGTTRTQIGEMLMENGLITNDSIFRFYTRLNGATGFQQGRYTLQPGMSYDEMIGLLTEAPPDRTTVRVVFGPGQTLYEFGKRCEEAGMLFTAEEFVEEAQNGDYSDISFFKYITQDPNTYLKLEGYLAPDTYDFYSDATPRTVIRRLLEKFNSNLTLDDLQRMEELQIGLREAITLASIIEKEASYPDVENQHSVSGVFWNRMTKDNEEIPRKTLGSDATWYYLRNWVGPAFGGEDAIPRNIYDAYVTSDNYENARVGLPAGPICNPSATAIQAALWPEQNDFFYFLTDDAGEYYYSRNYREHQQKNEQAERVNEELAAAAASQANAGEEDEDGEEE